MKTSAPLVKAPMVLEIKGNSLDDGPGIRSVVFLKGCPLSCVWCHNPESKAHNPEIGFDPGRCVGCRTCRETCTENALSKDNPFFVDRTKCTLCFDCVDTCPSGALEQTGKAMTVEEILTTVIRDKPFFDTSGGGVTFSGGEPALYTAFLGRAAEAFKSNGIHVLVETCGLFDSRLFTELAYPHLDQIYFDIKLMDSRYHKRYCGRSNKTILENFRTLYRRSRNGGVPVLPRIPLIPGITDTRENLEAIIALFNEEGVTETRLLPYHPLWQEKNRKLGIEPPSGTETKPDGPLDQWPPKERVADCENLFKRAGILTE